MVTKWDDEKGCYIKEDIIKREIDVYNNRRNGSSTINQTLACGLKTKNYKWSSNKNIVIPSPEMPLIYVSNYAFPTCKSQSLGNIQKELTELEVHNCYAKILKHILQKERC